MSVTPEMSVGRATIISFALTEAEVSDLETLALYRGTSLRTVVKEALIRYRIDMGDEIMKAYVDREAFNAWAR